MSNTIKQLHDFLNGAAGDGFVIDEVDAGDLFMSIFDDQGKINARFAGEAGGASELIDVLRMAATFMEIANDWNFHECEIDGEMKSTYDWLLVVQAAIAKATGA